MDEAIKDEAIVEDRTGEGIGIGQILGIGIGLSSGIPIAIICIILLV